MNLVNNAFKFSVENRGNINIKVEFQRMDSNSMTRLCFVIHDHGIGIPKKE